jgi:hypothetical protein
VFAQAPAAGIASTIAGMSIRLRILKTNFIT